MKSRQLLPYLAAMILSSAAWAQIPADFNTSGNVNADDLRLFLRTKNGNTGGPSMMLADLNADNMVNATDQALMTRGALGQPVAFRINPAGGNPGDTVRIVGLNLNTTPAVQFNGTNSPSITNVPNAMAPGVGVSVGLDVQVPALAGDGPVTVMVAGQTLTIPVFRTLVTVNLSVTASVSEGSPITVTATLDKPAFDDVRVDVASSNGMMNGAVSPDDYMAIPSNTTITIPAGMLSNSIQISTVNDNAIEVTENFSVTISNANRIIGGNPSNQFVTVGTATQMAMITDDDGMATLSFNAPSSMVNENDGMVSVQVLLTLPVGKSLGANVMASVQDAGGGTATSGADYSAIGTLTATFNSGSGTLSTAPVMVNIINDTLIEPDETINLSLTGTSPAAITQSGMPTSHALTINRDNGDGIAQISFTTASSMTTEGPSAMVSLTMTTSVGGALLGANVSAQVSDAGSGSATSGTDYTALTPPLMAQFTSGQGNGAMRNVTINLVDDSLVESPETIALSLGMASPMEIATVTGTTSHTLTINDDEMATVQFAMATDTVAENVSGGTYQFNVTLSLTGDGTPTLSAPVSVAVNQNAGGSAGAGDFTYTPQTAMFTTAAVDGATFAITVGITNDADPEMAETVFFGFATPSGPATVGTPAMFTLTIMDDDTPPTATIDLGGAGVPNATFDITGTISPVVPTAVVSGSDSFFQNQTLTFSISTNITSGGPFTYQGVGAASGVDSVTPVSGTIVHSITATSSIVYQLSSTATAADVQGVIRALTAQGPGTVGGVITVTLSGPNGVSRTITVN